jgi:hypothetical protein
MAPSPYPMVWSAISEYEESVVGILKCFSLSQPREFFVITRNLHHCQKVDGCLQGGFSLEEVEIKFRPKSNGTESIFCCENKHKFIQQQDRDIISSILKINNILIPLTLFLNTDLNI